MSTMHTPTPDELRAAVMLRSRLEAEFSRACLAAGVLDGWIATCRDRGEVRTAFKDVVKQAESSYGKSLIDPEAT